MKLADLVNYAVNKTNFAQPKDYLEFCFQYLLFIENKDSLQARIVSQNERNYNFFQYGQEADYSITRPINTDLMYEAGSFEVAAKLFTEVLSHLRKGEKPGDEYRHIVNRVIYTAQQSIGATLDALSANKSNQARKVNGDLFERLIQLLIKELNVDCEAGTIQVPIKDEQGEILFSSSYQQDLIIKNDDTVKIIGSVKTSSKDRIDKIFMDKFLYSKLTETALPHIAIFLNDVQRKNSLQKNKYGINSTFLSGHFKAFTIKLNPLDGVYYCDIRPNMIKDELLSKHIKTIDHFFYQDLWTLLNQEKFGLEEVAVIKENE